MSSTQEEYFGTGQENEKLRSEIAQLKQNLEKEEFLKKTLYKQWSELHALILAKEGELKLLKSTNLLYKYSFYLILILAIPGYYFISNGSGERIASSSQAASSPAIAIKQVRTNNPPTIPLPDAKVKEKDIIQPNSIKPKIATINRPVVEKPLVDSVRNFIYWEGWSAYYEKSKNPYKKSAQKAEVWLAGWKEGENDARRMVAKNLLDTLK
ncbi:MAG: hypothetical protein ABIO81_06765 [Ginsengibacter sp.]